LREAAMTKTAAPEHFSTNGKAQFDGGTSEHALRFGSSTSLGIVTFSDFFW